MAIEEQLAAEQRAEEARVAQLAAQAEQERVEAEKKEVRVPSACREYASGT